VLGEEWEGRVSIPNGSHVIGLLCSGIRDHRDHRDRTVGERGPGRYGGSRSTGNSREMRVTRRAVLLGRGARTVVAPACHSPQISRLASNVGRACRAGTPSAVVPCALAFPRKLDVPGRSRDPGFMLAAAGLCMSIETALRGRC